MTKNYYTDCSKGRYDLLHPEKYMPNAPTPWYKSAWEKKMFILCDVHPMITLWGYEPPPISIVYMSPKFQKLATYKPDLYVEVTDADGAKSKYLIEIKPTTYSVVPKMPHPPANQADEAVWERYRKRKVSYETKLMDVMVNHAKWAAAEEWCRQRGVNWFIANEKNMGHLFDCNVHF